MVSTILQTISRSVWTDQNTTATTWCRRWYRSWRRWRCHVSFQRSSMAQCTPQTVRTEPGWAIVGLLQFPFLRLELLLPPSLYRTEESLKMTTTSLQVRALVQYHVLQEKNWSEMSSFIQGAHPGLNSEHIWTPKKWTTSLNEPWNIMGGGLHILKSPYNLHVRCCITYFHLTLLTE